MAVVFSEIQRCQNPQFAQIAQKATKVQTQVKDLEAALALEKAGRVGVDGELEKLRAEAADEREAWAAERARLRTRMNNNEEL